MMTLMMCLATTVSFGQTFNGIELGKNLVQTQLELKNKGFVLLKNSGNVYQYSGKVGSDNVEVYIVCTPKTKTIWKLQVEIDKSYSWFSAKNSFDKYYGILSEKYGQSKDDYKFFSSPYYDGDGYELQALYVDKCFWTSAWNDTNQNTISLELVSYERGISLTLISYENKIGVELKITEQNEIDNKTF